MKKSIVTLVTLGIVLLAAPAVSVAQVGKAYSTSSAAACAFKCKC
jgi:hypothetical protein